ANARPAVNSVRDESRTLNSLPIRRVILYSNGVAYIERRGMVSGNAEINLSFKQSQVDDVLKSMVVLDLNQGKIGAVSYNSSAPASARMSEIPFSVNATSAEGSGIAGVLAQLQGAKVSVVTTKGVAIGSVLTVERKTVRSEKETTTTSVLVIASDSGEISSYDLSDVRSVRLLDEGTRADVSEFASASASARRRDAKTITVTSEGTGQRQMVVSYTIAAPIWKTTYRAVLDKDGKPFFQGWAIVDNISEEDWENVQMSLVSGSPISFIQNLQKPFYRYRPVVPTPEDLELSPQIHEPGGEGVGAGASSGIGGVVMDANGAVIPGASITIRNEATGQSYSAYSDSSGRFSQPGIPPGSYTITANASGFNTLNVRSARSGRSFNLRLEVGSVNAAVDVTANQIESVPLNGRNFSHLANISAATSRANTFLMDGVQTTVSEALTSGTGGVQTAAKGEEIGDLFEYRIERPVSVARNRSALIPIIQQKMEGERVAIYNENVRRDRPYSGMLLKNTSDLTFESGSITVIDGDAYAGEALMDRLKAKEQRLISFALDLGTNVKVTPKQFREPARLIKAVNGVLQIHYFSTEEKVYTVTNQTDRPKIVYIEYPIRYGWELSDSSPKPDYTTQSFYRFRIELGAFENKDVPISLRRPLVDSYQIGSINKDQLQMFVTQRYISDDTREAIEKLIVLRSQIAGLEDRMDGFDDEAKAIAADQKRLRENIESLAKTAEARSLIARYIAKAGEQETRLEEMEKERKTVNAEKEKLERELAVAITTFEVK
ncbi:MAG TPA: carboxypeptidase regulatory-like domain-containing protein, partial [Pyrinomonadaceae bacterium]